MEIYEAEVVQLLNPEVNLRELTQLDHQGWVNYFQINTPGPLIIPIILETLPIPLIIKIMEASL